MIHAAVQRSLDAFADPPGPAIVATSGGLDSTVLARVLVPILRARGHRPLLAGLDHGWRCFDAERAQLKALARELAVELRLGSAAPDPGQVQRSGPEAAAREARHAWLRSVAAGAPIHLGHHRDDQAETVLLFGASMEAKRGDLRRPLLDVPRSGLRALAEQAGWGWCEDPTNQDLDRPRNRLRHRVVPQLRARGGVPALLSRGLKERARRTYVDAEARAALPRVRRRAGSFHTVLDRPALQELPPAVARAVLRRCCAGEGRGPSTRALDAALDGARGRYDLGGGWTASIQSDALHLTRPLPAVEPKPLRDSVHWPGVGTIRRERQAVATSPGPDGRSGTVLPGVDGALWVAPAGRGRRMRPAGLGGSKRVSHLLREAGVPAPHRSAWPVVVDPQDRVLWIPGVRASEPAPLPMVGPGATLLLFTDGFARS